MQTMFYGASRFNQNLCAWASKSPQLGLGGSGSMFSYTSCQYKATPVLSATPGDPHDGPFCFAC
jgi:hypothetical protein